MPIETVGVIGAGVMGSGVAQNLAQTGHRVILIDKTVAVLDAARQTITRGVRYHRLLVPGAAVVDVEEALSMIDFTTSLDALEQAEFVVENVSENWNVKRTIYERIDELCGTDVVFAANTSAIPIKLIASATFRPACVLGMHFMNPVPLKKTVELIRSEETSDGTLQTATGLLQAMDKDWILVNDAPGFVSNRVLMVTINEAISVVHEGVASARDVDELFRRCFGHRMGPLGTADLIGLDTILSTLRVLWEQLGHDKYQPCPLLVQLVESNRLGCKSGQGFFAYDVPLAGAVV